MEEIEYMLKEQLKKKGLWKNPNLNGEHSND